jgi:hypothetical protein
VACANLKLEKENVTASYWMLSEKHKMLAEKAEREKGELAEAHAVELVKINKELDKET